jgi:hypothetical protein
MNEQIDARNPEEFSKRIQEILTNGGSGMMDIIWGPALELDPENLLNLQSLDDTIDKVTHWGTSEK